MSKHQNRWHHLELADDLETYPERVSHVAGVRQPHRTLDGRDLTVAAAPAQTANTTAFGASLDLVARAAGFMDKWRLLSVTVLAQLVVVAGLVLGAIDQIMAVVVTVLQMVAGLWLALQATRSR